MRLSRMLDFPKEYMLYLDLDISKFQLHSKDFVAPPTIK